MTKALGGRLKPMAVAVFIIAATSLPLVYLPADEPYRKLAYPFIAVQGIGLAIMLNTGTSLISDVIGATLVLGGSLRERLAGRLQSGIAKARPDLRRPVILEGEYKAQNDD